MADKVKQILARPIQLAEQVAKAAEEASSSKQECLELKSKAEKLAALLRQTARAADDLYARPTRRIVDYTEQVLEKALALVLKCKAHGVVKRAFTITPTASFRKMNMLLENSIGDVEWLRRVAAADGGGDDVGLPPIAANEPILCFIWGQIAALCYGSPAARCDAAASLVALASDNQRLGELIVEEGGVAPLLKLLKEGKSDGQENAVRAIRLLGRDHETVLHIVHSGACQVFAKMLKQGPMKVQAAVAWAVSELVSHSPQSQDLFAQNNVVRLLVGHLAFETVQEHSKYAIASKSSLIYAIANQIQQNNSTNHYYSQGKDRELEDAETKAEMKAMAARALWFLARGNSAICRGITESRALLCFAVLLEKGPKDVQYNSAMAVMEITAVAEKDSELRKSAFNPSSPACKAIADQLLRIIEDDDPNLLIPCVRTIGNLARTFRATETRMISPLVKLLDEREPEVAREAAIALAKFACIENYLHLDHCKAIISAGGAKHLVQLVYFEQIVQSSALILLCFIAIHVPDSKELARAEVLTVLEWASKQAFAVQDEMVERLLFDAKSRLELYQSRGSRGFK